MFLRFLFLGWRKKDESTFEFVGVQNFEPLQRSDIPIGGTGILPVRSGKTPEPLTLTAKTA